MSLKLISDRLLGNLTTSNYVHGSVTTTVCVLVLNLQLAMSSGSKGTVIHYKQVNPNV